jgi:hypothetical protein
MAARGSGTRLLLEGGGGAVQAAGVRKAGDAGYQSRNSAKRDSANAFVTLMAYQPSEEKSNLFIGTAKMAAAKAMTNLGGPRRLQYHESGSAAAGYAKRYGVTRKATRRPLERKKHLA